ncbi:MAG: hypothetical protein GY725_20970 [bacterium]|nr:hypothetical protein [bacterium]
MACLLALTLMTSSTAMAEPMQLGDIEFVKIIETNACDEEACRNDQDVLRACDDEGGADPGATPQYTSFDRGGRIIGECLLTCRNRHRGNRIKAGTREVCGLVPEPRPGTLGFGDGPDPFGLCRWIVDDSDPQNRRRLVCVRVHQRDATGFPWLESN